MPSPVPSTDRAFDIIYQRVYSDTPTVDLDLTEMSRYAYATGYWDNTLAVSPDSTSEFELKPIVFEGTPYLDIIDVSPGNYLYADLDINYKANDKGSLESLTNLALDGTIHRFKKKFQIISNNTYSYSTLIKNNLEFAPGSQSYTSTFYANDSAIYQRYVDSVLTEGIAFTINTKFYKNNDLLYNLQYDINTSYINVNKVKDGEGTETEYWCGSVYDYSHVLLENILYDDIVYIEQEYEISFTNINVLRWWWAYDWSVDGIHRYFEFSMDPHVESTYLDYIQNIGDDEFRLNTNIIHLNQSMFSGSVTVLNSINKPIPIYSAARRIHIRPNFSNEETAYIYAVSESGDKTILNWPE